MRMLTDLIDLPRRTTALALAALLGSTVSVPAGAASQASDAPGGVRLQMLLRDGRWIDGRVDRIGTDGFSLTRVSTATDPAAGEIKSDEVVACLVGPDAYRSMAFLTQMSAGTLVFGDGQLLPGTLRPDLRQPRWEHRWIGAVPIKTDLISELRLVATRRAPARPDSDSVLLQNGDVVFGFIESIGEEVLLEPSGGEAETDQASSKPSTGQGGADAAPEASALRRIQLDRVAAIAFAALEQPRAADALLWTADGTIVRAKNVAFDSESGWRFFLADPNLAPQGDPKPFTGAVARPTAFLFDREAMTPLVSCGAPEYRPTESSYRYSTRPETRIEPAEQSLLGLGSVEFDGPVHAVFRLPTALAGSEVAFTAEIALAEPAPTDARVSVTLRLGEAAVETLVLDSGTRRRSVRLGCRVEGDARLQIVVEDGGNGIGGDRIVVHRACFVRQR